MASGHSDYRKNIDIAQQSLSALSANVNIVAQTLDKMNVDVVAQAVGNIAVNIAQQALSNLKVDVNAQTLSKLVVDIASQTLANLKIDINAQTIGNVAMNIAGQSLSQIVQRNKYGAMQSSVVYTTVAGSGVTTIRTISGKGVVYGSWFHLYSGLPDPELVVYVVVDGVEIQTPPLYALSECYRDSAPVVYPVLDLYDNSLKKYFGRHSVGLTFESSYVEKIANSLPGSYTCDSYMYYALVV